VHSARSPYGLHTTKEKVGGAHPTEKVFRGLSLLVGLDYTAFANTN